MLCNCVLVDVNGQLSDVSVDDGKLHEFLGGKVTFVGAIPELSAVAVGVAACYGDMNRHSLGDYIEENVKGRILLVGSDSFGRAMHVHSSSVLHLLDTYH